MTFSQRLKQARENKGLTQAQVANAIGVAKSTYSGYETGNSEPSMNIIASLMKLFEVRPDFLWQDEVSFAEGNVIENKLLNMYRQLNEEGQEKLLGYADDLLQAGKYI